MSSFKETEFSAVAMSTQKKKNKKHPWTYLNQHGKQIDVEHERELA